MATDLILTLSERERLAVARAVVAELVDPAARQVLNLARLELVHYQPQAEPGLLDVVAHPYNYLPCGFLLPQDEYRDWQARLVGLAAQEARQIAQRLSSGCVVRQEGRGFARVI